MLAFRPHADFHQLFGPFLDPDGVDLLNRLLEFDPESRITAQEALKHPFFDQIRPIHPSDEQHWSWLVKGSGCCPSCSLADNQQPLCRASLADEISTEEIQGMYMRNNLNEEIHPVMF